MWCTATKLKPRSFVTTVTGHKFRRYMNLLNSCPKHHPKFSGGAYTPGINFERTHTLGKLLVKRAAEIAATVTKRFISGNKPIQGNQGRILCIITYVVGDLLSMLYFMHRILPERRKRNNGIMQRFVIF